MPYRVNGQYIMEGLTSSFFFTIGGSVFMILDRVQEQPATPRLNKVRHNLKTSDTVQCSENIFSPPRVIRVNDGSHGVSASTDVSRLLVYNRLIYHLLGVHENQIAGKPSRINWQTKSLMWKKFAYGTMKSLAKSTVNKLAANLGCTFCEHVKRSLTVKPAVNHAAVMM